MKNSVITIKNGEICTIFKVYIIDGVPEVVKHENCRIVTKYYSIAYLHSVKDGNGEVLYEQTSKFPQIDEIRIGYAFWDESSAIEYRKKLISEEIEKCISEIDHFTKKLKLLRECE